MIRAAVLYFARPAQQARLKALAEALAKGMQKQGAQVDVINAVQTRDTKLTGYHYIAIGCDVRSLFKGVLPTELAPALGNGGIITGKRSFAFVSSAPLGAGSTLTKLMKALEHEGMMLRYSEIFAKPDDAAAVGQRLKLD
jgi:multimeric flavodoxin WrbA